MNNHLSPQELRRIGRILKIARESQGQNLAILADKCNLSVMDLVAVESGEQSQLMKRGHKWPDCAMLYVQKSYGFIKIRTLPDFPCLRRG